MDQPLIDPDNDKHIQVVATHSDKLIPLVDNNQQQPQVIHFAPSYSPVPTRGAFHHRSHPSGTSRPTDYRHTSRHDPRPAPYPPRRSDTPHTPVSPEEEDIGSSDSSSNSSDYSSDSDASKDELDDDDVPSQPPKTGFGFSAATWSSTNNSQTAPPPAAMHRNATYERRARDRSRVVYEDTHYEKKDIHYVMEERHSSRYYPNSHPHPPPSAFTRQHRAYSASSNHYPPRRTSVSPERSYSYPTPTSSSYRRPVSPEPLYSEYREYRDNRHHREREREREKEQRERERERMAMTSRSSQTSPVRVEPLHPTGPRNFIRLLTPTRYRRSITSPTSDNEYTRDSRWDRDQEHEVRERERKLEREREEREEREREREREKQREIQRAKYQYESRVPPPPPSLSAPLTLRPPPQSRDTKPLTLSATRMAPPRSTNGTSNPLSSNAHTANQYPPGTSPPPPPGVVNKPLSKRNGSNTNKSPRDAFAPPRMVIPGPGGEHKPTRDEEDYDMGEDEMDDDDDDEYQPRGTTGAPPPPASASAASAPRRTNSISTKRTAGLISAPGGSSTSTFALSGGPSAPANNNGTTSTTTTFHVTTPRAISASLAAAQNAASQAGTAAAQAEAEKAEAEKMRIPSFKRGGKTRYSCVYCSKDFSRKNDAYRHMSRKHNDNATEFICVCGRVLSRGDALTRHMRTCRESKEKGGGTAAAQMVVGMGAYAGGAAAKLVSAGMGGAKRKGGKKRKIGEMEMDGEGEEELVDDVSVEEED